MNRIELSLVLAYEPPASAPPWGSTWDDSIDYPGIRATVSLPCDEQSLLADECIARDTQCCGDLLVPSWGRWDGAGRRERWEIFRAPTLEAAEAAARYWHAQGCEVIDGLLRARAARLSRRDWTIVSAHAVHGTVMAPVVDDKESEVTL